MTKESRFCPLTQTGHRRIILMVVRTFTTEAPEPKPGHPGDERRRAKGAGARQGQSRPPGRATPKQPGERTSRRRGPERKAGRLGHEAEPMEHPPPANPPRDRDETQQGPTKVGP